MHAPVAPISARWGLIRGSGGVDPIPARGRGDDFGPASSALGNPPGKRLGDPLEILLGTWGVWGAIPISGPPTDAKHMSNAKLSHVRRESRPNFEVEPTQFRPTQFRGRPRRRDRRPRRHRSARLRARRTVRGRDQGCLLPYSGGPGGPTGARTPSQPIEDPLDPRHRGEIT